MLPRRGRPIGAANGCTARRRCSCGSPASRARALTLLLVGGAAGPLGGDRLRFSLTVGDGCTVAVRSVAAALVQPGPHGDHSELDVDVSVGEDAVLDVVAGADGERERERPPRATSASRSPRRARPPSPSASPSVVTARSAGGSRSTSASTSPARRCSITRPCSLRERWPGRARTGRGDRSPPPSSSALDCRNPPLTSRRPARMRSCTCRRAARSSPR